MPSTHPSNLGDRRRSAIAGCGGILYCGWKSKVPSIWPICSMTFAYIHDKICSSHSVSFIQLLCYEYLIGISSLSIFQQVASGLNRVGCWCINDLYGCSKAFHVRSLLLMHVT